MKKVSLSKTLLIGAASAAAAMLFAPKSGKQLRGDFKEKVKEMMHQGKDKADNLVSDVKTSYHEAEEEMNDSQPEIESTAEKGEEWLDQVGEEQDMMEYPDASGSYPTGLFADDSTDFPAEETYEPDAYDEESSSIPTTHIDADDKNNLEREHSDTIRVSIEDEDESYPFAREILNDLEDEARS